MKRKDMASLSKKRARRYLSIIKESMQPVSMPYIRVSRLGLISSSVK
jgi:hypothetical protein